MIEWASLSVSNLFFHLTTAVEARAWQARRRNAAAKPGTTTTEAEKENKVAIARGLHLFPFRTEKLNPATPMVLRKWESR